MPLLRPEPFFTPSPRSRRRRRGGGGGGGNSFDGNPENLANRLLWIDGSDTAQAAGDPATGITSYTSKDPVGYVLDVVSGTVTLTGGALYANGSGGYFPTWTSIGGGTLPALTDAGTTYDVMVVLDGSNVTVHIDDAVETATGVLAPIGAGTIQGERSTFHFGGLAFGSSPWAADIFQIVATSDLLTADDFAAFRAWSP